MDKEYKENYENYITEMIHVEITMKKKVTLSRILVRKTWKITSSLFKEKERRNFFMRRSYSSVSEHCDK